MKKIYSFSIFSLLAVNLIFAQAPIPNGSFENWGATDPTAWGTSDGVLVSFSQPDPGTAEKDTVPANVYAGLYSIRLTNKIVSTPFGAQEIPGVVSLGTLGFDITTFSPTITGYAYTDRPDSIRFAAKFTSGPGGTDTGNVSVTLTRWNGNETVVIGNVVVPVVDNSSFTVFTKKITYFSVLAPDTLYIQGIGTSSQTGTVMDSKLWLDDMSVIGLDTAFKAYINPSENVDACDGDTIVLATDDISPNTYQWFKNNAPLNTQTQPQFNAVSSGSYYVQVTKGGTVYTSDTIQVVINPVTPVNYIVPPSQDTVCLNAAPFALSGATPAGGFYFGDAVDSTGTFAPSEAATGANEVTYYYTNNFGCASFATVTIIGKVCTGIEVLEAGLNVNIYPNPASDFMIVETDSKLIGGSIEVFDALGKLVAKDAISNIKSNMDVNNLTSGLYSIRLVNTAGKTVANAKMSVAH